MINLNAWARAAFLTTQIFILAASAQAQESTTVIVQMPCGVAGTPPCDVQLDATGLVSPALAASDASLNPNFNLISIAAPSLSFAFPFQNTGCTVTSPTRSVMGRSTSLGIDYCKVSGVVIDVASILAYFLTAGYLIHLAFKPRGE
jgi:hypothetical protein